VIATLFALSKFTKSPFVLSLNNNFTFHFFLDKYIVLIKIQALALKS